MRTTALFAALLIPLLALGQDTPKVLTPAEAKKHVDEKVTVQFDVKSTGGGSGAIYLNSLPDYREADNFAVVIFRNNLEPFAQAKIADPAAYYKGKTIQVTGFVSEYRSQKQIKVDGPTQIKVVEADVSPKAAAPMYKKVGKSK